MTSDLLGEIFYHLCDSGPLQLRHLLLVSRHFYDAFMNQFRLWTIISLDVLFAHHFKDRFGHGSRFVEQCALRSGPLPLCFSIDLSGLLTYDWYSLTPLMMMFGDSDGIFYRKCTSLLMRTDANSDSGTRTRKLLEYLPSRLPSVQYISLSHLSDCINGSQFPNCKSVEWFPQVTPCPPSWRRSFQHVTTLSFGKPSRWVDYDMDILSRFPLLHDLALFTEYGKTSSHGVISQQPVKFEHLQILRTHGHIPQAVLSRFVAPALQELHLNANAEHFTSIAALNNSFEPLCQYIYALLPQAVSTKEPDWAINLSEMVQYSTRSEALYVSKWMEEECKRFISGLDVVLHVQ